MYIFTLLNILSMAADPMGTPLAVSGQLTYSTVNSTTNNVVADRSRALYTGTNTSTTVTTAMKSTILTLTMTPTAATTYIVQFSATFTINGTVTSTAVATLTFGGSLNATYTFNLPIYQAGVGYGTSGYCMSGSALAATLAAGSSGTASLAITSVTGQSTVVTSAYIIAVPI